LSNPLEKAHAESLLAFKCPTPSCPCEGTKEFPDHPGDLYCSDCFRGINTLRFRRVVPG
jgi:hypothetical protein